jgi:hypothetical protein
VGAEWLLWFGFKERGSSGEGKDQQNEGLCREGSPAGRGKPKTWGAAPLEKKDGFRFRFFCIFFLMLSKLPPQVWLKMKAIYRQNSFFGLQNWSLKFCVWPLISINSLGKKLNWVS